MSKLESAFYSNPALEDFIDFCQGLEIDTDKLPNMSDFELFGILTLFLSTKNISIIVLSDRVRTLFTNPEIQKDIDMNCFLFEKVDKKIVIVNEKKLNEFLEAALDGVETLKYLT
jgi:hypothetical protein